MKALSHQINIACRQVQIEMDSGMFGTKPSQRRYQPIFSVFACQANFYRAFYGFAVLQDCLLGAE
ncbi:hypothetical protein WM40_26620 [Robbsia andropogonis]|uniref:Uncharacterized protein n=1 Tax=Robbsia andropogonis TaxID=28092 RepID=A0A0F5JU51_9BURK|nr:hypothetical protein WM40_26620 [Robbsia andropogonis]